MPTVWTKQEPGWYTSPLGGVLHEADGWYAYPIDNAAPRKGPFKRAEDAKRALERE